MINVLTQEELAMNWGEIKKYIDRAMEHGMGEQTSHDMFVGAMNGRYECWEAVDEETGAILSYGMVRVNHFERQKQLQLVAAAGEGWDLYGPEALQYAEEVAKELGCSHITVWGRLGWRKKLKHYGYEETYTVMSKEV